MGKKIRYKFYSGSLLKPLLRYTVRLDIVTNKYSDPNGTRRANHWYKYGLTCNPLFKQPGYMTSIKEDPTTTSSYMVAQFLNGWKHGFYLKHIFSQQIQQSLDDINEMIELERTLQGHDDELEDEVA